MDKLSSPPGGKSSCRSTFISDYLYIDNAKISHAQESQSLLPGQRGCRSILGSKFVLVIEFDIVEVGLDFFRLWLLVPAMPVRRTPVELTASDANSSRLPQS